MILSEEIASRWISANRRSNWPKKQVIEGGWTLPAIPITRPPRREKNATCATCAPYAAIAPAESGFPWTEHRYYLDRTVWRCFLLPKMPARDCPTVKDLEFRVWQFRVEALQPVWRAGPHRMAFVASSAGKQGQVVAKAKTERPDWSRYGHLDFSIC